MKRLLIPFFLVSCLVARGDDSRQRLSLDDGWRFQVEPKIAVPVGENVVSITDWRIKESPQGEADKAAMTDPALSLADWTAARTGDDLTAAHKDKFVWYRTVLDARAINGPRNIFFTNAGPRVVVYLNGRKVVEHSANVHSLNASEVLQTGIAASENKPQIEEIDGVQQCFEACLEPFWNKSGPNVLTVMIRASARELNGIFGKVVLFGGFPPEIQPSFDDSAWRSVRVPHDYVVEGTFDARYNNGRAALPVPRAFYRRNLDIPASDRGRSLWIDFDGIYRDSCVWLNGHYLGNHASGYTGSRYEIAPFVNYGGVNTLVVRVDPRVAEGWWYEGGGIYRHVWLNVADPLHVAPLGTVVTSDVQGVTTTTPSAKVSLQTRVVNEGMSTQSATLVSTIIDPAGKPVARVETPLALNPGEDVEVTQRADVARAQLWSCETPLLYRVATRILRGSLEADSYETAFGIRTIRFDKDRGFFLNEKPLKILGTCNHLDFFGVGIAVPDNVQAWRIKKLQEMGSNAWRCAHGPPSPEFLDACDRLGMLVLDENRHLASTVDRKTDDGKGYALDDFSELDFLLRRDRNHPSVFLWSLANEEKNTGANAALLQQLVERTRQFDTTRLTTAAMIFAHGWGMEAVADVSGLNYSHKTYDEVRKNLPNKPLISTENGSARADRGIYYDYPPSPDPKRNPPYYIRNYSTWYAADSAPEANENITQWKPIAERAWLSGGFYWTGFDYKGEPSPSHWPAISSHFGIFDLCGFPKDNYYYYKAWWTKAPIVHIMPHWNWPGKEGEPMRVVVFSNARKIELFLNGKSLGVQEMPPFQSVEWQVPYASGRLEARGTIDGHIVATDIVETTGAPAALVLRSDVATLRPNSQDAAVVEVSVLDARGRVVPTASDMVRFELSGPGAIAGVGNGDPACHEPDVASQRSAFNGHCAALVRTRGQSGKLLITASASGLKSATLEIACP